MTNHQDKLNSYLRSLRLDSNAKQYQNKTGVESRVMKGKRERLTQSSKLKSRKVPDKINARSLRHFSIKTSRMTATIDELPTEVLVKVFRMLTPQDLMTCSCVCQRWMTLAGDDLLWQPLYQRFKLSQPGKPDSVYTTHAGIKWKCAFMKRCLQRRNMQLKHLLKKKDPYTTLPANIDTMLRKFGVKWNIVFIDKNDVEHTYTHSDVFNFSTSITIRWYKVDFLSVDNIKTICFNSQAPVIFEKDGSPIAGCPQKTSLLLSMPWVTKQDTVTTVEDGTLKLNIVHPGVLIATWKDGGGIAFVSLCLHKFSLVERILFGSQTRIYQCIHAKPAPDDVDTQYGLHDFQCNIELRQQRAVCWSQRFTGLHCPKEEIKDGMVRLNLISSEEEEHHSKLTKKLCLPWKTDMFKGIVANMCVLDITLLDEFKKPFWHISHPVEVLKAEFHQLSLVYSREVLNVHYADEIGQLDCLVARNEDEGSNVISSLHISIKVEAINSWFSTSYS